MQKAILKQWKLYVLTFLLQDYDEPKLPDAPYEKNDSASNNNEMIEEWRSLQGSRVTGYVSLTKSAKTPWQKYKPKYMAKFQQKLISLEGRGVEYNGYF